MSRLNNSTLGNTSQVSANGETVNAAWKYLNSHVHEDLDLGSVELRASRRKIDWHIVPLMFGCYTMQFLDKVILNVRPAAPSSP